jgi:hypothetical protein
MNGKPFEYVRSTMISQFRACFVDEIGRLQPMSTRRLKIVVLRNAKSKMCTAQF